MGLSMGEGQGESGRWSNIRHGCLMEPTLGSGIPTLVQSRSEAVAGDKSAEWSDADNTRWIERRGQDPVFPSVRAAVE